MAAREHQAQPVIGDGRRAVLLTFMQLLHRDLRELGTFDVAPTDHIDGSTPRGHG